MKNLSVKVFRAINDPARCEKFMEGHTNVLKIYGVTKVTSAKKDWFTDPFVYAIVVESPETGEVFGGARIHIDGGNFPLPIESAIVDFDPKVRPLIKEYSVAGTGELCGLWVSRQLAGMGISFVLIQAAIAIVDQIHLNSLFALCSPFTVSMFQKVGFGVETRLGNEGTFYYPKEDLIATAVFLPDPAILTAAEPEARESILELKGNSFLEKELRAGGQEINIKYNLKLQTDR